MGTRPYSDDTVKPFTPTELDDGSVVRLRKISDSADGYAEFMDEEGKDYIRLIGEKKPKKV